MAERGRTTTKSEKKKGGSKKSGGAGSRSRSRGKSRSSRSKSPSKGKKDNDGPQDWSMDELKSYIRGFATFNVDKDTNIGEVFINGKKILEEQLTILSELCKRFSEIQTISIKRCYLNDATMSQLLEPLKFLRHLKILDLSYNTLSKESISLIISNFSKARSKLVSLDLRNNMFEKENDGYDLYDAFERTITSLNGINLKESRLKATTLDFSAQQLRLPEVGIICRLLNDSRSFSVTEVNLSNNLINSHGIELLSEVLLDKKNILKLNLIQNPLNNNNLAPVLSGVTKLMHTVALNKYIQYINFSPNLNVPPDILERIENSLMVNRSRILILTTNFFADYADKRIRYGAPPFARNKLEGYEPAFDELDYAFARLNRVAEKTVQVIGDEIVLGNKIDTRKMNNNL